MDELKKLEEYLTAQGIPFKRTDEESGKLGFDRHQVTVVDSKGKYLWDAICQRGSWGYSQGLLEIYGKGILGKKKAEPIGYLTAQDVINMLENRKEN